MNLELGLEVEDAEFFPFGKAEELAELGVGVDLLLVGEVVGADIVRNGLRDVGTAFHGILFGLTEEGGEFATDGDRDLEDAGLAVAGIAFNASLLGLLASILDFTFGLLLETLGGGKEGTSRSDEGFKAGLDGLELILPGNRGIRSSVGSDWFSNSNWGGFNLGFGLLGDLLGFGDDRGWGSNGFNLGIGLLGNLLGFLGGRGRSRGSSDNGV